MKPKIPRKMWLVVAVNGEYSDQSEWECGVFTTKEKAEYYLEKVKQAEEDYDKACSKYYKAMEDWEENENPEPPIHKVDRIVEYTGGYTTHYSIIEIAVNPRARNPKYKPQPYEAKYDDDPE